MPISLIKKNQLDPNVADLVGQYGSGFFLPVSVSGDLTGFIGKALTNITGIKTLNSLQGIVSIIGNSGVNISIDTGNNYIVIAYTGTPVPPNLVFTTGDQVVDGIKNFVGNIQFSGNQLSTGYDQSLNTTDNVTFSGVGLGVDPLYVQHPTAFGVISALANDGSAVFANGYASIDSLGGAVFANYSTTIGQDGLVSFAYGAAQVHTDGTFWSNGGQLITGVDLTPYALNANTGQFVTVDQTDAFYGVNNPSGYITGYNQSLNTTDNPTFFGLTTNGAQGVTIGKFAVYQSDLNGDLEFYNGLNSIAGISTSRLSAGVSKINPDGSASFANGAASIDSLGSASFASGAAQIHADGTFWSNGGQLITGFDLTPYALNANTGSFVTVDQTGAFYAATNPSGYITGVDLTPYALNADLTGIYATYAQLTGLSGYEASVTNLLATYAQLTGYSGFEATVDAAFATYSQLTGLSGYAAAVTNLATTGQTLSSRISSLSGTLTGNYVLKAQTGQFMPITQYGNFYLKTNPSGFVTTAQTGLLTGSFYPNNNPSGFITADQSLNTSDNVAFNLLNWGPTIWNSKMGRLQSDGSLAIGSGDWTVIGTSGTVYVNSLKLTPGDYWSYYNGPFTDTGSALYTPDGTSLYWNGVPVMTGSAGDSQSNITGSPTFKTIYLNSDNYDPTGTAYIGSFGGELALTAFRIGKDGVGPLFYSTDGANQLGIDSLQGIEFGMGDKYGPNPNYSRILFLTGGGASFNDGAALINSNGSASFANGTTQIHTDGSVWVSGNQLITGVDKLQGNPVSAQSPQNGQTLQWNGSAWVPGAVAAGGNGGGGKVYYFDFINQSGILPTGGLSSSGNFKNSLLGVDYSIGSGSGQSADLVPRNSDVLVMGFVTPSGNPGITNIPPGLWDFNIWANTNSNNATETAIKAVVNIYNPDTSTYRYLASSDYVYLYDGTTISQYLLNVTVPQTGIAINERIYIQLFGKKNVTSTRTVTLYFDSYRPSHVHTTIPSVAGNGIVKVINGIYQTPATGIFDSDVDANAGIQQSKILGLTDSLSLLSNSITSLSGTLTGNLATTGSTLAGNITTLTSNLATTGSTLAGNITTLTSNLATTGSTLASSITSLSGTLTGNYISGNNTINGIMTISQTEYNAITPNPNVLYIITS
jgi:hypothetical protein